jgi:hypothetical protein
MNPGRTRADETASLAAQLSSAFNDVLVRSISLVHRTFQSHIYRPDADMFGEFSLDRATDRRRRLGRQSTIGTTYKQITT